MLLNEIANDGIFGGIKSSTFSIDIIIINVHVHVFITSMRTLRRL